MTEMRLIDWNRIFKEVEESLQENPHTTKEQRDMHNHEHNHFLCMLMEQPTINPEELPIVKELREQLEKVAVEEVAPVVHSEWVKKNENPLDGNYYCKHCGNGIDIADGSETPIDRGLFFCFNCGAKMKNK